VAQLLATLAAFAFSLSMLRQAVGLSSPWWWLTAFLCFLGLAKAAEPIYALKVPSGLRELRPWEASGEIYRRLCVPRFGILLRDTPLRFLNTSVYVSAHRRDPARMRRQVESAEAIHFWGALLLMPYMAWSLWSREGAAFGWLLVLQVVANAYPIMHLRSVRARFDRSRRMRTQGAVAVNPPFANNRSSRNR